MREYAVGQVWREYDFDFTTKERSLEALVRIVHIEEVDLADGKGGIRRERCANIEEYAVVGPYIGEYRHIALSYLDELDWEPSDEVEWCLARLGGEWSP